MGLTCVGCFFVACATQLPPKPPAPPTPPPPLLIASPQSATAVEDLEAQVQGPGDSQMLVRFGVGTDGRASHATVVLSELPPDL